MASAAFVGVYLQITTRDESGALTIQGSKPSMFGSMAADGPPTTLSDTGIDRVAFLQASLGRDSTYFLNGTTVGSRDLFQVRSMVGCIQWCQGVGCQGVGCEIHPPAGE